MIGVGGVEVRGMRNVFVCCACVCVYRVGGGAVLMSYQSSPCMCTCPNAHALFVIIPSQCP